MMGLDLRPHVMRNNSPQLGLWNRAALNGQGQRHAQGRGHIPDPGQGHEEDTQGEGDLIRGTSLTYFDNSIR